MTPGMADRRQRTWTRRVAVLLAWWVALWALTAWLNMEPQPLGLLAALGVLFAMTWWGHDRGSAWTATTWTSDARGRRLRSSADSRVSYLHRLIDDAAARKADGPSNASAASLQGILRDIAVDRLRNRAVASGAATIPSDTELIADHDPRLAAYLLAQPAPPTTRQTLTDIIDRIEAL